MNEETEKKVQSSRAIDWPILLIAVGLCLVFAIAIFFNQEVMDQVMTAFYTMVNHNFGWLWLVLCLVCFFFCVWLAFGPLGKKRFGNDKPDTSTFSFFTNMFVFSASASLVYWVFLEWWLYMMEPPFGVEPFSTEALKWASTYGSFHWGIIPNSIFTVMGIAFAYYFFILKKTSPRIGPAMSGVIGEKAANGIIGKICDILYITCQTLGSSGYALGVSLPIIGSFAAATFGIVNDFSTQTIIMIVITTLCAICLAAGLKKGLTVASNIRAIIFFVILILVFILGNTSFIMNNIVESIGWQLQHVFQMALYTGAAEQSAWSENWTMFFNIMFIMSWITGGVYFGKLSKGRTVREVVICSILAMAIGCMIFFWVVTNYSIDIYLGAPEAFAEAYEIGDYNAITYIVSTLPFSKVFMVAFLVYAFISAWTFIQSTVYSLAIVSQPYLAPEEEPSRISRIVWAVVIGVLTMAFLSIGGVQTVKNACIVAGVPMFIMGCILVISIFKDIFKNWLPKVKGEDTIEDIQAALNGSGVQAAAVGGGGVVSAMKAAQETTQTGEPILADSRSS